MMLQFLSGSSPAPAPVPGQPTPPPFDPARATTLYVWTGNSGKNFVKFLSETESDLDAKAKYLRGVADYLKKAAKQIKEAEEAAEASANGI